MSDISKRTCVTFRETFHPTEPQVTIQRKYDSCVAHVGYQNGTQILNLAVDCMASGRIKHELLHALGFVHMHCDPRRDNYVKILEENIIEGQEYNFEKYPATEITDLGLEYDYGSIMHYSTTEFTKNGLPTMIPLQPGVRIGQLDGLSPKDFQKIARVYCQKKNNNNNAI
ncbi:zinc metalloproteinase nas-14 [Drosophila busckii]|nr:zinc metalloproteinase nas-14 [Drosophila busckii]